MREEESKRGGVRRKSLSRDPASGTERKKGREFAVVS